MIRFGPAGIPLSCKGRTLKDGIEDVHNLSLTAMEVQMVRPSRFSRYPEDEEVGKTIRDIVEDFVIEIIRDDELICSPDVPIEEDDELIYMSSSITNNFGSLYNTGEIAKRMDVSMSIHTPYYMDLGSETPLAEMCMDSIRHAGLILNALGGDTVVTSLGLYNGASKEETESRIFDNVEAIMGWWQEENLKPRLGIEVTGHQETFGSLDQILDMCDNIEGIVPVINFPHHHSRTGGSLKEIKDFIDLIEKVEPYCKGGIYSQFSGVEHADGEEKKYTPIKKGDLKFETLADALTEVRPEITVISCSPLLEHDAMYMRIIEERVLSKKVAKMLKEMKKQATAEAPGE
ncbi:MAG: TIM barrel protein [Methanomassiliicoccaceae archaeon]|nr:TIM barrel protein [Methanomassiliicoccaceae archaeon]